MKKFFQKKFWQEFFADKENVLLFALCVAGVVLLSLLLVGIIISVLALIIVPAIFIAAIVAFIIVARVLYKKRYDQTHEKLREERRRRASLNTGSFLAELKEDGGGLITDDTVRKAMEQEKKR